jgi:WhiB family redox-sensing transcriptional regulator
MNNREWYAEARCANVDPTTEIFYPPRDKTRYKVLAAQAKTYCLGKNGLNHCPVRAECLWEAIESDDQHGIWGGLSHRERNALVRKWQRLYKNQMTLKEFIFSLEKKEPPNDRP